MLDRKEVIKVPEINYEVIVGTTMPIEGYHLVNKRTNRSVGVGDLCTMKVLATLLQKQDDEVSDESVSNVSESVEYPEELRVLDEWVAACFMEDIMPSSLRELFPEQMNRRGELYTAWHTEYFKQD